VSGITNVTQRVRLCAFDPWLVRACDRHVAEMTPSQVVELVLRAEVLVELVGIAHELETGDKRDHGAGLVGRDVLVGVAERVRAGEAVSLPTHTSQTS
jgi:hypothetical protein